MATMARPGSQSAQSAQPYSAAYLFIGHMGLVVYAANVCMRSFWLSIVFVGREHIRFVNKTIFTALWYDDVVCQWPFSSSSSGCSAIEFVSFVSLLLLLIRSCCCWFCSSFQFNGQFSIVISIQCAIRNGERCSTRRYNYGAESIYAIAWDISSNAGKSVSLTQVDFHGLMKFPSQCAKRNGQYATQCVPACGTECVLLMAKQIGQTVCENVAWKLQNFFANRFESLRFWCAVLNVNKRCMLSIRSVKQNQKELIKKIETVSFRPIMRSTKAPISI